MARAVELCSRLVPFVQSRQSSRLCAVEKSGNLSLRERLEGSHGLECLIENLLAVDAGDLDGDGQVEAIVQRLDGLLRYCCRGCSDRQSTSCRGAQCPSRIRTGRTS